MRFYETVFYPDPPGEAIHMGYFADYEMAATSCLAAIQGGRVVVEEIEMTGFAASFEKLRCRHCGGSGCTCCEGRGWNAPPFPDHTRAVTALVETVKSVYMDAHEACVTVVGSRFRIDFKTLLTVPDAPEQIMAELARRDVQVTRVSVQAITAAWRRVEAFIAPVT